MTHNDWLAIDQKRCRHPYREDSSIEDLAAWGRRLPAAPLLHEAGLEEVIPAMS
jgi:hypothetical protein